MNTNTFVALAFAVVGAGTATAPVALAQAPARAAALASAAGEIRGTIVGAKDSLPVANASVAVRNTRDSSLVAGALANPTGTFRIQGLRPGAYRVRVTALGYGPRFTDIVISPETLAIDVGRLPLERAVVSLQGVEILEERAAVTVEPDRNSYRSKDVAPAAANASDVLDNVPSVAVDGDGKVSLRGNENVAVQVNGRPTPMSGTQLGAYLKSLPASVIERVEVVPNPSAKYDPEGMAGIINIVLKANTDLGISGGFNAEAASDERFNASGNLGYQSGPVTSFLTLGINNDDRSHVGLNDRERISALATPLSYTEQDIAALSGNAGQNLTANLDYTLNKRDVLSNALTINHRGSSDNTVTGYNELSATRSVLDQYDRVRRGTMSGLMFDYDIALKRTLDPRKHELSSEVRFNRARDEQASTLWRQAAGGSARTDGELTVIDAVAKQLTVQADYLRAYSPKTKLESGYKTTARWIDRDYDVSRDAQGTGVWMPSNVSNGLSFSETVHALYGVLSQSVGRAELQAGLRAEQASRDFKLAGAAQNFPFSYTSLFPSGIAMINLNEATQAKVSYSRRIRRPGTQELNPFPSFMDIQNVFIGNPKLSPEYTDAYELGLTRSGKVGTLQLAPFYRRTTNVIRVLINTADVISGREVTSLSFSNLATSNSWGTDLNGSLRLGSKLTGFGGFNVFKMVTDGGSLSSVGSNGVGWMARVNGTSQITPSLALSAAYNYRAPMKIEGGEFAALQNTTFSARYKLSADRGFLQIRVMDAFNTSRFRIRASDSNIIQLTERSSGVRGVFMAYQYSFGQVPKVREVKAEPVQGTAFP